MSTLKVEFQQCWNLQEVLKYAASSMVESLNKTPGGKKITDVRCALEAPSQRNNQQWKVTIEVTIDNKTTTGKTGWKHKVNSIWWKGSGSGLYNWQELSLGRGAVSCEVEYASQGVPYTHQVAVVFF